jgi:hypothetical protein
VQIAAGTTSSAADAKTWGMARGHFALGTFSFHYLLCRVLFSVSSGVMDIWHLLDCSRILDMGRYTYTSSLSISILLLQGGWSSRTSP